MEAYQKCNILHVINKTIIKKYCQNDDIDYKKIKLVELFMYLLYTKKIKRSTLIKVVEKLKKSINEHPESNKLDVVIYRIKPIEKLLGSSMPSDEFCPPEKLFEGLNEEAIEKVYNDNLLTEKTKNMIRDLIDKFQQIVSEWDNEATIAPFGSFVNGFKLDKNSDLDLSISVPSKIHIHPETYYSELFSLLKSNIGRNWKAINTGKLFIMMCEYDYDEE